MNNKNIIIILCIILAIAITFNIFLRNKDTYFSETITDKTWYNYDMSSGNYNTLYIDSKTNEIRTSLSSNENQYSYNYNKIKKIINYNNNFLKIDNISKNSISIEYQNKNIIFYNSVNIAIENAFENYYLKSVSEYKKEKDHVLEYLKTDITSLNENVSSNKYQKIIFQGDNCTSIECTMSLGIYEYWMIKNENILYMDSSEFDNNQLEELKKTSKIFINDINYYNGIYPRIIITKNNKIIDDYEIKCTGLNCKKFYKIEFN